MREPKSDPELLIDELRDQARRAAADLDEGNELLRHALGDLANARPEDTLEWEAAELIEELIDVIRKAYAGGDIQELTAPFCEPLARLIRANHGVDPMNEGD